MGYHCNTGLESANVLDCSNSFSSETGKDGNCPDGSNSDGLWAEWEEIFLRLDQQDGVHDGRILRSSLSSWLETLSLQDTVKLEMMQGVGRARVSNMVLNLVFPIFGNNIQHG